MIFCKCPYCEKETFDHPKTEYCHHCGKSVVHNICSNETCFSRQNDVMIPSDAQYCPICGGRTYINPELPF